MTIGRDEALKTLWKCLFHGHVVVPEELDEIMTAIILTTPIPDGFGDDVGSRLRDVRPQRED